MLDTPFYLEGYWNISCFFHLSFLRYLSLNPASQIPNNFHAKLGKTELLITLDKEMTSA